MRIKSTENREFRDFKAEIKAIGEPTNNIGRIQGYGSVFGVVDSYDEIVDAGAFEKSLRQNGMPMMLMQHYWGDVAGIWTKATEDQHGLLIEGEINLEVQKAREYYSLIKQGALKGLSIGFRTLDSYYDKDNKRHLKEVELMEVSLVSFPANREALITGVKNIAKTEREFEKFLRDAGYSATQAKSIVSKGFRTFANDQRDADESEALVAALKNMADNFKGVTNA